MDCWLRKAGGWKSGPFPLSSGSNASIEPKAAWVLLFAVIATDSEPKRRFCVLSESAGFFISEARQSCLWVAPAPRRKARLPRASPRYNYQPTRTNRKDADLARWPSQRQLKPKVRIRSIPVWLRWFRSAPSVVGFDLLVLFFCHHCVDQLIWRRWFRCRSFNENILA